MIVAYVVVAVVAVVVAVIFTSKFIPISQPSTPRVRIDQTLDTVIFRGQQANLS